MKSITIDIRMSGSGGIGSYLNALMPFFLKHYECTLIGTYDELVPYRGKPGVTVLETKIKPFSLRELLWFPKQLLEKINKTELYYSPYCNIPQGIKIPIYTTIHDVVFLDMPNLAGASGTFIRKMFYLYACHKSKAIFTVSEFSKKRILKNLKPHKDIIVTYNAVPDWFMVNEGKAERDDIIIFVGNIKKHKGLNTLVDAYLQARKLGLQSKLLIVGNRDNFRTQDNNIEHKINIEGFGLIDFTGRISDEDLRKLYGRARLLVQPSLYEGFGMPPMEAISQGCPALISDIDVFREIYKDFPVTFFKAKDSRDLAGKLLEEMNKSYTPVTVPEIYSFEKTFNVIKQTFGE